MTRRDPRAPVAGAVALAIAGVTGLLAPLAARADPAAPKSAAECRALTDFNARGACWDALDREGLHDEKVVKKRNFGLGLQPPADAAIVPAKVKKEKKRRNPDAEEITNLTLTIASVGDTPLGRILLTSTDGAIWEQTDGDAVVDRPAPGDTFQVSKGMMGGYMCHVTRWQPVRCQRDE